MPFVIVICSLICRYYYETVRGRTLCMYLITVIGKYSGGFFLNYKAIFIFD